MSPKSPVYFGVRLPKELLDRADKFVEESLFFRTRSEFIRRLLEDYLDIVEADS